MMTVPMEYSDLNDPSALLHDAALKIASQLDYDPQKVTLALWALAESDPSRPFDLHNPVHRRALFAAIRVGTDSNPIPYGEADITNRFVKAKANDLRYCNKEWRRWVGAGWAGDQGAAIEHIILDMCVRISALALRKKEINRTQAQQIQSDAMVRKVLRLAQSHPGIYTRPNQWDADPMLLGTPNGVVDLRSGQFRAAQRSDLVLKRAAVDPIPENRNAVDSYYGCPEWKKFLEWTTQNDLGLQHYLQRICGYTLTADFSEQVLFFLWGPGGNGKGTLIDTMFGLLGDYATVGDLRAFASQRPGYQVHSTETAQLAGHRMVAVQETGRAYSWDDAKIKSLTGGDKQTARGIGKDPTDFDPIFKFWFSSNHGPSVQVADDAMRRRLHLINFTSKYDVADTTLKQKLKKEYSGILRWAINGCVAWQAGREFNGDGLRPPEVVTEASKQHLDDQDVLGQWINECCEKDQAYLTEKKELWDSWKVWAKDRNEKSNDSQRFLAKALEERGFRLGTSHPTSRRERLVGIRVKF